MNINIYPICYYPIFHYPIFHYPTIPYNTILYQTRDNIIFFYYGNLTYVYNHLSRKYEIGCVPNNIIIDKQMPICVNYANMC
jgi:hypothetical protein